MKAKIIAAVAMLGVAGCTTPPAEYAAMLSPQDPKWQSPECEQIRAEALSYEAGQRKPLNLGAAMLLGPYGLGIAVAGREHQEKQRRLFVREMHMRCSSLPLPRNLGHPAGLRERANRN